MPAEADPPGGHFLGSIPVGFGNFAAGAGGVGAPLQQQLVPSAHPQLSQQPHLAPGVYGAPAIGHAVPLTVGGPAPAAANPAYGGGYYGGYPGHLVAGAGVYGGGYAAAGYAAAGAGAAAGVYGGGYVGQNPHAAPVHVAPVPTAHAAHAAAGYGSPSYVGGAVGAVVGGAPVTGYSYGAAYAPSYGGYGQPPVMNSAPAGYGPPGMVGPPAVPPVPGMQAPGAQNGPQLA